MNTSGVFSIFRNASCAMRAVMNRDLGLPAAKTPTSAPAEKNFSEALVTTTADLMLRSRRASDRKSTRLNSSHVEISYAVFCLKKKKKETKNKNTQKNKKKTYNTNYRTTTDRLCTSRYHSRKS